MKNGKILLFVWSGLFACACSSNNEPNDAGGGTDAHADTGGPADSGGGDTGVKDAGNEAASEAAAPVNGCTTFTDQTANGGTITGPMNATPAQYSPNCVHIKVGQKVTWNVDLTSHPLGAAGGDTPTPITTTSTGTTVSFTFPNAGTFGFHCNVHPTIMFGAVQVTP